MNEPKPETKMKTTRTREAILAEIDTIQLWFAGRTYGYSEKSEENRRQFEAMSKVEDLLVEELAKLDN